MLGRVWNAIKDAVDGLKTLGTAAIFILLGLADWYDVVDVKPALTALFGEDRGAKLMVLLPLVFASLRFVSNGAPRWTKQWREARGPIGQVDDPEPNLKEHC